jgi:hypothetical protein
MACRYRRQLAARAATAESASRVRLSSGSRSLDAKHAGEHDAVGETEPGVYLRRIDPEHFDLDQHLATFGHGYRHVAYLQRLERPRPVEHDGAHISPLA